MPPAAHDSDRTIVVRSTSEATLQPGAKILNDTYVIESCLGKGGMGEVYKAEHIELGAKRAIKIIIPEYSQNQQYVQLFIEEARKLSLVNNDAIVRYYEFSRDEVGARYLVMEFVDGESLATLLMGRRLPPAEVIALLKRLAQGLAAAYERGIKAHRDISPANIILPQGKVENAKVIDFGIAKSGDAGGVTLIGSDFAGKFSYASPEQIGLYGGPDHVDQKSDIYSLGLVLAAAAIGFGKRLDMGTEPASVTIARQKVPDLGAVPSELRPIIARMLEPRPENRPQTMRALLDEVDQMTGAAAAGQPSASALLQPVPALPSRPAIPMQPPPPPSPAPRQLAHSTTASPVAEGSKSRWLVWTGGAAVAAAGLVAIAVIALRPTPSPEKIQAEIKELVAGYRCSDVSYSVGPDRVATLTGFVSTAEDLKQLHQRIDGISGIAGSHLDVRLRTWPYCEVANLLKPIFAGPGASGPALALASMGTVANIGAPLVLDARAPTFDSYAYVDYFNAKGEVRHLFPNDKDALNFRPARNDFTLGRPPQVGMQSCWTLGGEAGEQLVTYIASSVPLFAAPRAATENARDYLAALSHAVGGAVAGSKLAAMLSFNLEPAGEGHGSQPPCPSPAN